ncbi:MAG: MerR family transcriptional regulator [Myxococcota bacterium]
MSEDVKDSPRYRVGMVARLTGLSTHTLRMWEKRHQAVVPARTPAGGRLYSDADVERLMLLKRLVDGGHSIGSISPLENEELTRTLAVQRPPEPRIQAAPTDVRDRFLAAIAALDVHGAEQLLARAAVALEPRAFLLDVVRPILEEMGRRYEAGQLRIVHEHAASAILRNLLVSLTRMFPRSSRERTAIIATPAGERHEFGALMVAMLVAMKGWHIIYLGTDLPASEIVYAAEKSDASLVLLSAVRMNGEQAASEVREVERGLPSNVDLVLGGAAGSVVPLERGRFIEDLGSLEAILGR